MRIPRLSILTFAALLLDTTQDSGPEIPKAGTSKEEWEKYNKDRLAHLQALDDEEERRFQELVELVRKVKR